MAAPSTLPTINQEVRFTDANGAIHIAYVTSFGPLYTEEGQVNLFVFTDTSDPYDINSCNINYSSTITDTYTWHYISDV